MYANHNTWRTFFEDMATKAARRLDDDDDENDIMGVTIP